jgi:hypothetical protein
MGGNDERPTMWLSNHDFGVDECHPIELQVGFNSREIAGRDSNLSWEKMKGNSL